MQPNLVQPDRIQQLAAQSSYIFRGTVVRINATTVPIIPASETTAVVYVEEVISGKDLAGIVKQEITIQMRQPNSLQPKQQVLFFANPIAFGKSVVVQEVGHLPSEGSGSSAGLAQMKAELPLRQRLAQADVIVQARVISARPLQKEQRLLPSEHDPEWAEAILEPETTMKGNVPKRVSLLFPLSNDIAWFASPKPKAGTEAVFLLQRPEKSLRPEMLRGIAAMAATVGTERFTALHPLDVHPKEQIQHIKALLAQ